MEHYAGNKFSPYIANGIVSGKIKTVRSDEIEIKPIAKSTNTPH